MKRASILLHSLVSLALISLFFLANLQIYQHLYSQHINLQNYYRAQIMASMARHRYHEDFVVYVANAEKENIENPEIHSDSLDMDLNDEEISESMPNENMRARPEESSQLIQDEVGMSEQKLVIDQSEADQVTSQNQERQLNQESSGESIHLPDKHTYYFNQGQVVVNVVNQDNQEITYQVYLDTDGHSYSF
ncbi:hypothetical protein AWM75_02145 [Aerococcus urinaehominis]|uniref:Uncharacterized protein n=1 Tax=Aerococcus urinaehominis TaxID=128944 RepID=A0A0X8FKA6_9LACT|nr:hypothetical protein [Aerococcus urinaehominis]AMB98864.1 hypothetical protein AWM75_02145 [Aerococcus urinaehominis]SDM16777.1 hypothetical protein SAMN04487985_10737 [Aerococcus urinaehominis]